MNHLSEIIKAMSEACETANKAKNFVTVSKGIVMIFLAIAAVMLVWNIPDIIQAIAPNGLIG